MGAPSFRLGVGVGAGCALRHLSPGTDDSAVQVVFLAGAVSVVGALRGDRVGGEERVEGKEAKAETRSTGTA